MKKVLIYVLLLIVLIPFGVSAKDKGKDDNLVKVYIFEAGGCPACNAQVEYLEGLSSYNKKFTIIKKELYVDHIDWKQGKDYKLGLDVANAFTAKGYSDASYQSTPFVVVSNFYAASGYNTSLETIINKAYEEGDKDVVSCIEKGKDDCEIVKSSGSPSSEEQQSSESNNAGGLIILTVLVGAIVLILMAGNKNKKNA